MNAPTLERLLSAASRPQNKVSMASTYQVTGFPQQSWARGSPSPGQPARVTADGQHRRRVRGSPALPRARRARPLSARKAPLQARGRSAETRPSEGRECARAFKGSGDPGRRRRRREQRPDSPHQLVPAPHRYTPITCSQSSVATLRLALRAHPCPGPRGCEEGPGSGCRLIEPAVPSAERRCEPGPGPAAAPRCAAPGADAGARLALGCPGGAVGTGRRGRGKRAGERDAAPRGVWMCAAARAGPQPAAS